MKSYFAALMVMATVANATESPSTEKPVYALGDKAAVSGSLIKKSPVWSPSYPLNLRYEQLSSEQKAKLNEHYEHIAEGDEPPYPAEGLKPLVQAIYEIQSKLLVKGTLDLLVDVDENGTATAVSALESPSAEMTKFASYVILLTKFKPAKCGEKGCKMQYPLGFDLSFRYSD